MKSWVKLYTEINRDPKMVRLTWAHKGIWAALLALAGEVDVRNGDGQETGQIYSVEDTALIIRCDIAEFTEAVKVFLRPTAEGENGMLYEQNGTLFITNYGKRQARPPSARPEATKERKRQQRTRESQGSHEAVTTPRESVTPLDSDSDVDSETEAEGIAATTPPPKPPKRRRKRKPDSRTQHPAIQAVREVTNRYPPKPIWDDIIKLLGDEPRVDDMRLCFKEWVKPGFKPTNFAWLFDWYVKGIPARGSPRESRVQQQTADAIREFMEDDDG